MNSIQSSKALFNKSHLINCRGKLLDLSVPRVMGILNITPDSFFDGGKFTEEKAIIKQAGKLLAEGADIIDIGAHSSRPGAKIIAESTEIKRLLPAIKAVLSKYPQTIISVDTYRSAVAKKAIEAGASIVNDISGGDLDKNMFKTIAGLKVPYVLMHMAGTPGDMQKNPVYKDVVNEVFTSLLKRVSELRKLGVTDIIVDPGFGFGKTVEHNFSLLNHLDAFRALDCPVLAGVSRKSMICKVLGVNPEKALNGTTALNMVALLNGAAILRVHDVKEAVEVVKLFSQIDATEKK